MRRRNFLKWFGSGAVVAALPTVAIAKTQISESTPTKPEPIIDGLIEHPQWANSNFQYGYKGYGLSWAGWKDLYGNHGTFSGQWLATPWENGHWGSGPELYVSYPGHARIFGDGDIYITSKKWNQKSISTSTPESDLSKLKQEQLKRICRFIDYVKSLSGNKKRLGKLRVNGWRG